jgi:hypothetical protein
MLRNGHIRYQVFISSTWEDLQSERQAAAKAISTLKCFPAGMELFPATADDSWSLIKREIDDSDYYVLILGGRYGSIDPRTGVGYTEQEFDYASETGKRIIAFLHKDFSTLPEKKRETNAKRLAQLRRFHKKAKKHRHVNFWRSPQELETAVVNSCRNLFDTYPAEGWLRANAARQEFPGLLAVSSGAGREAAFQQIRDRATQRLTIVGVGMTKLTMHAMQSLAHRASKVPIDFLMLDPDYLENNLAYADLLQRFLDIPNFATYLRSSFERLKTFTEGWNSEPTNTNKLRLSVYNTLPTISAVVIDAESPAAEMVIEFFLFQCGEHRPRLHIKRTEDPDGMFHRIKSQLDNLWSSARRVVEHQ